MRKMIVSAIAAGALFAGSATVADAALGAWWSFNNSWNSDQGDGLWTGPDFYHATVNNSPYDDGVWTGPTDDKMLPVTDTFSGSPGVLIGAGAFDTAPTTATVGAYIDVSDLVGNNNGNMSSNTWGSFQGTSLNRPSGTFSGGSLVMSGSSNNGSTFTVALTDPAYQITDITWAQRGTSTGYNSRIVEESTDGVTWNQIFGDLGTLGSSWQVKSAATSTDAIKYLRFTVNGATSSNGNNRFDNIQLNVDTFVPEPASLALLGLGGLAMLRRR